VDPTAYIRRALTGAASEGDGGAVVDLVETLFSVLPAETAGEDFVEYLYTLPDADRAFIMRFVVVVLQDGKWHLITANKPN
jgi:hypothetical protein